MAFTKVQIKGFDPSKSLATATGGMVRMHISTSIKTFLYFIRFLLWLKGPAPWASTVSDKGLTETFILDASSAAMKALIDRIPLAHQTGLEGAVKLIPFVGMLGGLLLGPLLLGLRFSSILIGPAHPAHQRACGGPNSGTSAGITGNRSSHSANGGPAGPTS
jgi:hypothetical protein